MIVPIHSQILDDLTSNTAKLTLSHTCGILQTTVFLISFKLDQPSYVHKKSKKNFNISFIAKSLLIYKNQRFFA